MEKQEQKLISLKNISFNYDEDKIFNNFDFDVYKNNHVAILGKSGTGKSTLLKLLSGLLKAKSGHIDIRANLKFSLLFQDNTLLPWMTIAKNIKFFSKQSDENIIEILKSLQIENTADKYPDMLSGGMLQRANLACSLSVKPDILLMDEPFSSLDHLTKLDNYKYLLEQINKSGITTVMVTHDINEAILFSKNIFIISEADKKIVHKVNIDENLNKIEMLTAPEFTKAYKDILKMIKL